MVIMLTGGIVAVAYASEFFIAWYTGSPYENFTYMSVGAATGRLWMGILVIDFIQYFDSSIAVDTKV